MARVIERLLNLLAFLLTTTRPVTADEIRHRVAGYDNESDEAFRRMFERDKDLLRRMGIPLELAEGEGWAMGRGYLVDPESYRLADPGLSDEERAALAVAAQIVRLGGGPVAQEALLKLGGLVPSGGAEPLGADLGVAGDQLGELFSAVIERRMVEFSYRQRPRRIAPYGLAHRRGHWYLVGEGGEGIRVFRVDRMEDTKVGANGDAFTRPSGFDLRSAVDAHPWETGGDADLVAVVHFEADIAWWAARLLGLPEPEGDFEVPLHVSNVDAFIGWVLSFDDKAWVVEPEEVRAALVRRVGEALL